MVMSREVSGTGLEGDGPDSEPERWHRPIIPVFAGYSVGVILGRYTSAPSVFWLVLMLVVILLSVWGIARGLRSWGYWILALCLMVPIGAAWHESNAASGSVQLFEDMLPRKGRLLRFRGTVDREPALSRWRRPFSTTAETRWRAQIRISSVQGRTGNWEPVQGSLTVYGDIPAPRIVVGDKVEFLAEAKRNRSPSNPGEPDYASIYRRRGIAGTATVPSGRAVEVISRPSWFISPRVLIGRLRAFVKRGLIWGRHRADPLTVALTLGERSGLTGEEWELMAEAGSVHFLAISGLHVGIFAMCVALLLSLCRCPVRARSVILIVLVWLYVAFTGEKLSARRAAWMVSLVAAAPLLGRRCDPLSALAGAGFFILLLDPGAIFSVGFQFTFMAVLGLSCLSGQVKRIFWPWKDLLDRVQDPSQRLLTTDLKEVLGGYLAVSFCVWGVLLPLTAYHFNRYSLLTPFINLVAWPIAFCLIVFSFLFVPFSVIVPGSAGGLVWLGRSFSSALWNLLEIASRVPGFVVYTPRPPIWWVMGWYVVLGIWLFRERFRYGRRATVIGVILLGVASFHLGLLRGMNDTMRMTVVDVGHGQSVIMSSPDGSTMMYDAGGEGGGRAAGIAGALWDQGIEEIEALVVSHRDFDHYNLSAHLARRFQIQDLYMPPPVGGVTPTESAEALRSLAENSYWISRGNTLKTPTWSADVLHPTTDFLDTSIRRNNRSVVMMISYMGWDFLLAGDVESTATRRLVAEARDKCDADVLLLPHHGSWDKSLPDLVDAVDPMIVLVSNGDRLDDRTVTMLERKGFRAGTGKKENVRRNVWNTFRDGALMLEVGSDEIHLKGFKSGRREVFKRNP